MAQAGKDKEVFKQMSDPYEEDVAPPIGVYQRLARKAWGNAVAGSRLPFQGSSEGSSPSSPTRSRWDLLASDCLHPRIEKCLFVGGKWWDLCLSCGMKLDILEKDISAFPLSW